MKLTESLILTKLEPKDAHSRRKLTEFGEKLYQKSRKVKKKSDYFVEVKRVFYHGHIVTFTIFDEDDVEVSITNLYEALVIKAGISAVGIYFGYILAKYCYLNL